MTKLYYTTQSRLAHEIAREYYGSQQYVFIATGYDLPNIHPSSNAKRVRDLWCEVSSIDDVSYRNLFDDNGKPRGHIPNDYPEIQLWFKPVSEGGKLGDGKGIDRWESHLETLRWVAEELKLDQGLISPEQFEDIQERMLLAQRTEDGFPIVYWIQVDEGRVDPSDFDPENDIYSTDEEFILPDLDVSETSLECKFYTEDCGVELEFPASFDEQVIRRAKA